jgi:nitrogen PTS system EIIA component
MTLADIIESRAVLPHIKAANKKQLLTELSQAMATVTGLDNKVILDTLVRREKLGSTGLGQGIAIPHGRIKGIDRVHGLFARLSTPIPFDSVDGENVDLVFVLLAPEHAGADHLTALARISRLLREPQTVKKLRGTDSAEGLYAILTEPTATASAA